MQSRLERVAAGRGVRRRVDFLLHDSISAPLTCGFIRPAILLPRDASAWSEGDLHRALVHEFEHIRRWDWATQILGRIACACYWFHPLAWTAQRHLMLEAERACDDAVVLAADSTTYAQQLVDLAGRMSKSRMQPAMGMAERSDLSTRVSAILDSRQRRGQVGSPLAICVVGAVAFAVFGLAPLRAVAQSAAPKERASVAAVSTQRSGRLDRALFEASERGDTPQMSQLIREGANVNAQLAGDGTPLIAAAREGHDDAVRLLLENDANPNLGIRGDGSPLIMAARNRHLSTVRLLLERGAVIHMPVLGDGNPLIMAARGGSEEIVRFLLDRGANIEQVVQGDENALMEASASGHLPIVKLLVSRGANVNSRVWVQPQYDRPGEWRTPLSRARQHGHTEIESYLRSVGAKE